MAKPKVSKRFFTDMVESEKAFTSGDSEMWLEAGHPIYEVQIVQKFKLKIDGDGNRSIPKEKK